MKRFNSFKIYQATKKPKISNKSEEVVNEDSDSEEEKELPFPFNISQKIQTEMTYPGQVKVTVIRETRATAYAK